MTNPRLIDADALLAFLAFQQTVEPVGMPEHLRILEAEARARGLAQVQAWVESQLVRGKVAA